MSDKILLSHADRLGLRDPSTLKKAETFLRILNSKPVGKAITDTAKVIMCLDLAATSQGLAFDKNSAMKLSGLRKGVYQNNLNNLEKMLDLDELLTIKDLCVQFDCMQARELAENILTNYQKHDTKIKDINHPQYVAAAVHTSCRINKIKVDKNRFKTISRLKAAQWNELKDEFEKFASTMGLTATNQTSKVDSIYSDDLKLNDNTDFNISDEKETKEVEIENYEVWKERILKEAAIEILQKEITN